MGCLTKTLILGASLLGGYYLGNKVVNTNTKTDLYEIIQKEDKHYLKSKEHNKTLQLRTFDKKTYAGDLEHLIRGAKETRGEQYE